MIRRVIIAALLLGATGLGGCPWYTKPERLSRNARIVEGVKPASALEAKYRKLWDAMTPVMDPGRELFHLGIPGHSSIAVWYLAPRPQPSDGEEACTWGYGEVVRACTLDGTCKDLAIVPVDMGNCAYRIDVRNLSSNTEYELTFTSLDGQRNRVTNARTAPNAEDFSFVAYSCNKAYLARKKNHGLRFGAVNTHALLGLRAKGLAAPEWLGTGWTAATTPAFQLGLGDQIYVDPDPGMGISGLSFFGGQHADKWFHDPHSSRSLLETVYRYTFALPAWDFAMARIPSAFIWDDHEIRDGWGIQGDEEYPAKFWPAYFAVAESMYNSFQSSRNPPLQGQPTASPCAGKYDVRFDWGDATSVLMFDRRHGPSCKSSFYATGQVERLGKMLNSATKDEPHLFILGMNSSISFAGTRPGKGVAIAMDWSMLDDMEEASALQRAFRDQLLQPLLKHFETNPKHQLLIISGDVHYSAVAYLRLEHGGKQRVFGHEVVSSGIANRIGARGRTQDKIIRNNMPAVSYTSGDYTMRAFQAASITSSTAFAEIGVKRRKDKMDVQLRFWISGNYTGKGKRVDRANMAKEVADAATKGDLKSSEYEPKKKTSVVTKTLAIMPLELKLPETPGSNSLQDQSIGFTCTGDISDIITAWCGTLGWNGCFTP